MGASGVGRAVGRGRSQEHALIRAAQAGDAAAANLLLEEAMPWVRGIATSFRNERIHVDDLVQIGLLEVWKAVRSFDLSRPVLLRTFAQKAVEGEIRRAARTQHVVSMPVVDAVLIGRVAAIRNRLGQELGRKPSEEEVAREAGISVGKLIDLSRIAEGVLDLDKLKQEEQEEGTIADIGADLDTYSDAEVRELVVAYAQLRARLSGSRREDRSSAVGSRRPGTFVHLRLLDLEWALERLPDDEYEVVRLVGLEHQRREPVAEELGVSVRTVDNRYRRALTSIRVLLNGSRVAPRLRSFRFALDFDPLRSLEACVRRHQSFFDDLARHAEADAQLRDLRVKWLPAKNACVPVLEVGEREVSLPLLSLVRSA